jgi:hypothetical protein
MKLSKKTLFLSVSAFLVVALLGGGIYAVNNYDVDSEISKDSNASSLVDQALTNSSDDAETPIIESESSEDTQKMTKEVTPATQSSAKPFVMDAMKK